MQLQHYLFQHLAWLLTFTYSELVLACKSSSILMLVHIKVLTSESYYWFQSFCLVDFRFNIQLKCKAGLVRVSGKMLSSKQDYLQWFKCYLTDVFSLCLAFLIFLLFNNAVAMSNLPIFDLFISWLITSYDVWSTVTYRYDCL